MCSAGPERAGTHAFAQTSARLAPVATTGQHGSSQSVHGGPAEARAARHPVASHRMAADAPDLECPVDLSDPYIVSALRALRDSGLDVADAVLAAPVPAQAHQPPAGAAAAPVLAVQLKRRPASPVIGLGAAVQAAARAPAPAPGAPLGHVLAPTSFSGFAMRPQPHTADGAAPLWPIFAQRAHPEHRQRVLSQQAWPHLRPIYFPAPVFPPPKPLSGALVRSSAASSTSGQATPALGVVPEPSHPGQQAQEPVPQTTPTPMPSVCGAAEPDPQQGHVGQVLAPADSRTEAAAVASSVWGVQLRHFPGKYGRCKGPSA